MIFETKCAGCDTPGDVICRTCRMALATRVVPAAPEGVIAAVPYSGRARDVVLGLKYRNRRAVARHLGGLVVNRLVRDGHGRVDVVTWAPTSGRRRGERGFDQAEFIARTVARQLHVPCRRLLDRRGRAGAQTGRSLVERRHAPSFVARPDLEGTTVLVIDDVVTTGSTMAAARDALDGVGASVVLAAVAATPQTVRAVEGRERTPSRRRGALTGVSGTKVAAGSGPLAPVVPLHGPSHRPQPSGDRVA